MNVKSFDEIMKGWLDNIHFGIPMQALERTAQTRTEEVIFSTPLISFVCICAAQGYYLPKAYYDTVTPTEACFVATLCVLTIIDSTVYLITNKKKR